MSTILTSESKTEADGLVAKTIVDEGLHASLRFDVAGCATSLDARKLLDRSSIAGGVFGGGEGQAGAALVGVVPRAFGVDRLCVSAKTTRAMTTNAPRPSNAPGSQTGARRV